MSKIIQIITILGNNQKHKWKGRDILDPLTNVSKCVISRTHTACVAFSFSDPATAQNTLLIVFTL